MLKRIAVVPLAAESLGVRSMCTYVETPDVRILFDAGVSLCPRRFSLPPHPLEFRAIAECRRRIADAACKAEIVTLSHYHMDHYTPSFEDWLCNWTEADETARQLYAGKTILAKNHRECVNPSQRRRGWLFEKTSGKVAGKLESADGKGYRFNGTTLRFSEPVSHGAEHSYLGWVLMATVDCDGERFVFAPDVQGPICNATLEAIAEERPQLLMIGGPPLYLLGTKVEESQIAAGLRNLERLVAGVPHVILDHHVLRDEDWRAKTDGVFRSAHGAGSTLQTAAEFVGRENAFLEARRRKLFAENPASEEFAKWMRKNEETQKYSKPPI